MSHQLFLDASQCTGLEISFGSIN